MRGAAGLVLAALVLAAPRVAAPEFRPPASSGSEGNQSFDVNLFGFTARAGLDVTHSVEWLVGATADVAQLWSPRVRLRPSLEVASQGSGVNVHWSGEIVYRFQPDAAPAIPYLGLGLGHMSGCSSCTTVWPTVTLGFELGLRPGINWLVEYHSLDRFSRHRFLVGLATRNASGGQ